MSHPRWPGFNTKTGNPVYDNQSRRMNQHMYRRTKAVLRIRAAGRKRRKELKRIEGGNYIKLWAAVMNDQYRKRRAAAEGKET